MNRAYDIDEGKAARHSMTRRSSAHDYTMTGIYHITIRVAEGLGQPLGTVVGSIDAPDGSADAPHTELTTLGRAIEDELLNTLHARYSMVRVMEYVIMPEHLHALIHVTSKIVSSQGKVQPLGQVMAGFKKGCNRRFWELNSDCGGKTATHTATGGAGSVYCGLPAGGYKVPSAASSGRQPLFAPGFCDVMPVDDEQLSTQRAYIRNNPRSRLLRSSHREWLQPRRGGIDTALTVAALYRYLREECRASQCTDETFKRIETLLLLEEEKGEKTYNGTGGGTGGGTGSGTGCGTGCGTAGSTRRVLVACDSYGDRSLLRRRCLPVVCHRKDRDRFEEQKRRCLEEAERGTVLVSARIAKGEQTIMDEGMSRGFAVVLIADNGFPDVYHPSAERIDRCSTGRLLIVTPWRYRYRGKNEAISVPECKTMNCVAQALCRKRDDWWKSEE